MKSKIHKMEKVKINLKLINFFLYSFELIFPIQKLNNLKVYKFVPNFNYIYFLFFSLDKFLNQT